jgi:hypothetical protein
MNLSEIHVQKIMNVKIGPDNTIITYNEKGQPLVTVPSASVLPSTWRECYSQSIKIMDGLLSGEVLNLYPSLYYCVKQSRNYFQNEVLRQKQAVEEGSSMLSPNISVIITSKKSKNLLPSIKQSISPARKISCLPEPDLKLPLIKMFMEMNGDIDKSIKNHIFAYNERNAEEKARVGKSKNLVEKTMRVRNYEKYSAVSPWVNNAMKFPLNTVRTLQRLQIMPQILFDLENPYFDESRSLADRIRVIHSCIVVQNFYRDKKQKIMARRAVMLQKWVRGFLGRKKALLAKTFRFRKIYYWERLKHWYPLLANKLKINKNTYTPIDYTKNIRNVIIIQKFIRGWIARKHLVWKKMFYIIRKRKEHEKFYIKKHKYWMACSTNEDLAFSYSKSSEEDILSYIAQNESKLGKSYEKPIYSMVKIKEKAELDIRIKLLGQAKADRIKALE